ncbi:unnamed protein product [Miscanthus lutarioriparius]|uniref:Uncharacterized protein n=1 Tax=Miscanthus lutarioriparius TaxID=422564 RepID=A0A811NKS6_9POAL|nr:unnamed protein product [Miscanthus lutarioriparius]
MLLLFLLLLQLLRLLLLQSLIAQVYLFKKMQTSKTMEALNEKKKQDESFSVNKCLDEVDTMELTDVEKAYAMNIFKSKIDRECYLWRQCWWRQYWQRQCLN